MIERIYSRSESNRFLGYYESDEVEVKYEI